MSSLRLHAPHAVVSGFLLAALLVTALPAGWADEPEVRSSPGQAMLDEARRYRAEGYQHQLRGEFDEAMTFYQKATELDPTYAAAFNDLAVMYEEKGWMDRAEAGYLRALELEPGYLDAHSNLGLLYERQGRIPEAVEQWRERVRLGDPNDVWTERARTLLRQHAPDVLAEHEASDLAREILSERLDGEPPPDVASVSALIDEGKALMDRGDVAGAMQRFEAARAVSPDDPAAVRAARAAREAQIEHALDRLFSKSQLYEKGLVLDVEQTVRGPSTDVLNVLEAPVPLGPAPVAVSEEEAGRQAMTARAQQVLPGIDFTDASLRDVLKALTELSGISIVVDEGAVAADARVTIHLQAITVLDALQTILRTQGLAYRVEENLIWVSSPERLKEQLIVHAYDVQDLVGKLHDFPGTALESAELESEGESE